MKDCDYDDILVGYSKIGAYGKSVQQCPSNVAAYGEPLQLALVPLRSRIDVRLGGRPDDEAACHPSK